MKSIDLADKMIFVYGPEMYEFDYSWHDTHADTAIFMIRAGIYSNLLD